MSVSSWLLFSLICLILWGLWGVVLKLAYREMPWTNVYFLSSLSSFILAFTVYLLTSRSGPVFSGSTYYALLAGLFGGLGYVFFIKALEKGSASIVIPLTALYPVITALLSIIILREKLALHQVIGITLAVIAIVLLSIEKT